MRVRLDEVVVKIAGDEDRFTTKLKYYIGGEHIDSESILINKRGLLKSDKGHTLGYQFHYPFQNGDTLFMTKNPYLKKCGMVNFDGICSVATFVLRTKNNDILLDKYLPIVTQTDDFWDFMESHKSGSVNYFITWKTLGSYEFELPSIEEQKKLAEVLWQIVATIESYKKLLSKTDEMVKAKFVEMFGDTNLFHEDTTWTPLKDVTKIITGTTPSTKDEENWNGEIPWITPAELDSNTLFVNETERHITENGRKSKHLEIMPIGTVLLSTRAPIGKVGITNIPMTCNQGFKNFICKENIINPIYLWYLLKNNTEYLKSRGAGTTFLELAKSTIEKIKIPLPEYSIQNQFASLVLKSEESKSAIQAPLDSLSAVYKKIIAENLGGSN